MRGASLVLLTWVAASVAAPVPKKPAATYFPIAVGSKWEFAWYEEKGELEVAYTLEVTKAEEKDGVRTVEIVTPVIGSSKRRVNTYRIDADGMWLTVEDGEELTTPQLYLRAKPKAKDQWDAPHRSLETKDKLTVMVGKEVETEVPAGTYQALPHERTVTWNGVKCSPTTTWYAASVGPVKIGPLNGPPLVLVKYTPGNDK